MVESDIDATKRREQVLAALIQQQKEKERISQEKARRRAEELQKNPIWLRDAERMNKKKMQLEAEKVCYISC
jgi:replicative DNA helicase